MEVDESGRFSTKIGRFLDAIVESRCIYSDSANSFVRFLSNRRSSRVFEV